MIEECSNVLEDILDAQLAEEAYQEYLSSGKKSRPFSELCKELDL